MGIQFYSIDADEVTPSRTGIWARRSEVEAAIKELRDLIDKADKMRNWFVHTTPEWNLETNKALDEYDKARAALESTK